MSVFAWGYGGQQRLDVEAAINGLPEQGAHEGVERVLKALAECNLPQEVLDKIADCCCASEAICVALDPYDEEGAAEEETYQEFVLDPLRTAALEALTALCDAGGLTEETYQAFLDDPLYAT